MAGNSPIITTGVIRVFARGSREKVRRWAVDCPEGLLPMSVQVFPPSWVKKHVPGLKTG